jgi:tellurite resistance protein TerC
MERGRMGRILFPFAEYWWIYAAFAVLILGLLTMDLALFHRRPRVIGFAESLGWTGIWTALALIFAFVLHRYAVWKFGAAAGDRAGMEFLTGYVVEWSLSLDNMFVFVVVFRHFGINEASQHRILFFGILGALVLRGIFIMLGAALLQYGWVVILFGVFLILSGIHMMFSINHEIEPEKGLIVRILKRAFPLAADVDGAHFFLRRNGQLFVTPIFLALAFIEAADVLFALDSVPAIFAITREPLIVYISNVFAILGLRTLYFMLAGAIARFHLLRYGLALILVFVGLKMSWLNAAWHGHFSIAVSLGIILGILAGSILLSLILPQRAHPGSAG